MNLTIFGNFYCNENEICNNYSLGTEEGYLKVKDMGWIEFLDELRIDYSEFERITGIHLSSILDDEWGCPTEI